MSKYQLEIWYISQNKMRIWQQTTLNMFISSSNNKCWPTPQKQHNIMKLDKYRHHYFFSMCFKYCEYEVLNSINDTDSCWYLLNNMNRLRPMPINCERVLVPLVTRQAQALDTYWMPCKYDSPACTCTLINSIATNNSNNTALWHHYKIVTIYKN